MENTWQLISGVLPLCPEGTYDHGILSTAQRCVIHGQVDAQAVKQYGLAATITKGELANNLNSIVAEIKGVSQSAARYINTPPNLLPVLSGSTTPQLAPFMSPARTPQALGSQGAIGLHGRPLSLGQQHVSHSSSTSSGRSNPVSPALHMMDNLRSGQIGNNPMLTAVAAVGNLVGSSIEVSSVYGATESVFDDLSVAKPAQVTLDRVAEALGLNTDPEFSMELDTNSKRQAALGTVDVSSLSGCTLNVHLSDCFALVDDSFGRRMLAEYNDELVRSWIDKTYGADDELENSVVDPEDAGDPRDIVVMRVETISLNKQRVAPRTSSDWVELCRRYCKWRGPNRPATKGRHPVLQLLIDSGPNVFLLHLLFNSWFGPTDLRERTMQEVSTPNVSPLRIVSVLLQRVNHLLKIEGVMKMESSESEAAQKQKRWLAGLQSTTTQSADIVWDSLRQFPGAFADGGQLQSIIVHTTMRKFVILSSTPRLP